MKWHLYKFESQLYLGANIQAVSSHVVAFNTREHYTVEMLPDDTMVKINNEVFSLPELTAKYKAKARKSGMEINEKLSLLIKNGKAITIQKECDEMMG